jgi:hypothetical protein
MLSVTVPGRAAENRDDDLGPEFPDDGHHVRQQRIARPETECLVGRLGVPEIVGAGEELACAVELAGGEEFLATDDAQLHAELGADQVLAALAAVQGEIGRLDAISPRQQGEQLVVLVVGVRADHEDALVGAELPQGAHQRRDAAGARRGQLLSRTGAGGAESNHEGEAERAPHY